MGVSVEKWLQGLGLQKYSGAFRDNDIDHRSLPYLTDEDLKELGVSLGHRRVMLAAITELETSLSASEAQPQDAEPSPESAAENRHLTALFIDLVGSTELINRIGAEEMRDLLHSYQDVVAGEVSRYGGHIAKYLGDGLMAFFGWPVSYEDHVTRAIKSGLAAVRRVRRITLPDGQPVSVRVGIASGPVVIGDLVGQNAREEGAVTGPAINLAARIQNFAPENGVVIPSDGTFSIADRFFRTEPLGAFDLKGFDGPQELICVIAEREAESRFHAAHGDTKQALVGRLFELRLLRQTWEKACAGYGETMIVSGEPGIGKSRLTEEFLATLPATPAPDLIRLNCSPYFSSSAFHPLTERIRQDAGIGPEDTEQEIVRRIRGLLETRQGADVEAALPIYVSLIAPEAGLAQELDSLPPQERKDQTIHMLVDMLRTRATNRPVMLLVEDAHWIDPSTQQVLDRIIASCRDIPLMILVTHRPDWSHDWAGNNDHTAFLKLTRFDSEQVTHLVRQILGSDPDPALLRDIVEKTDGVPLFVEEVTRAFSEGGSGSRAEVPASLQGVLMARLDAVSDTARQAALTASVIGREFDLTLLGAALGWSSSGVADCVDELRKAGIVFESGLHRGLCIFRHALIRDTAYQSMLKSTRRAQHAGVARALIALRPVEIERSPELAARHLSEAGDHDAAFDYWCSATRKSLDRSASEEALSHAEETMRAARAMRKPTQEQMIVAQILLGRSFETIGHLPDSLKMLKTAAQQAREQGLTALFVQAAYHFTESALLSNEYIDQAYELCREALAGLAEEEKQERCGILSQLARCAMLLGLLADSTEFSRQALQLAEMLGDDKARFAVMMSRFMAPLIARGDGEVGQWRHRLEEMHDVAGRLGDIDRGRERTINFFICSEMGDRECMDHSLAGLTEVGAVRNHLQLHWVEQHARAMVAILEGDFGVAEKLAENALRIGRESHGAHVEGVYGVQMFTIRREQGRLSEVAPVIRKLIDDDPEDMTWKPGFAVVAAELGFAPAASRILDEIEGYGFNLPLDAMYSTSLAYLADACIALRNERMAQNIYDLLLPYRECTITAGATTVCNGAAGRRLGGLAEVMGEWAVAQEHFETALTLDAAMRARTWLAHTQADYAAALRRNGQPRDIARADRFETEALEIATELGMISLTSKIGGTRH